MPPPLLAAIARCQAEPSNVEAACNLGGLFMDYSYFDYAENIRKQLLSALERMCAKNASPDVIFNLLQLIYKNFTKKLETEEYARICFQSWQGSVIPYARRFQDPVLPHSLHAPTKEKPWRVGFLLPNAVILGHTDGMLEVIANRPTGMPWAERPIVYTLNGDLPLLNEKVRALGAEITNLATLAPRETILQRVQSLRRQIANDGVTQLVWVSAPPGADFLMAMRLAPIQLFWTLKFHPFRIPEIDGYITYGGWSEATRVIHGEEWKVVPFLLAKPAGAVNPDRVSATRALFAQHPVLFGALARTEKLNSPEYLNAVVEILRANPTSGYIWTGREQHGGIQRHFEEAKVADRTHFVGWVDTALYAQVLDIFLETYPFGCGVTAMQALASGTPLVSFAAPETQFGMHFIRPLAEGSPAAAEIRSLLSGNALGAPLLYAHSSHEYVCLANKLADNSEWRRAVGRAGQEYYHRYLEDSSRMGRRFFEVVATTTRVG